LTEMGPLSVSHDALESLALRYRERFEIIALVHRRELYKVPDVIYFEFPKIKSSWVRRLIFEFWSSKKISDQIKPKLWLSMDNVTPRVSSEIQAVYCHNPSPFYKFQFTDIFLDWKFGLFTLFFRYLYAINIRRNKHIIVQQSWIRSKFRSFYGVENVIVAHPTINASTEPFTVSQSSTSRPEAHPYRFFYPAFPRTFKNMEIILQAARLLESSGFKEFELLLTFDGSETSYASKMVAQFSDVKSVRWLGLLPRARIFALYEEADCLLFPSKLETWGLPVTEFKRTRKPILIADLPYAHETVGSYDQVVFFDPANSQRLADMMKAAATGQQVFSEAKAEAIAEPYAKTWQELWSLILP